MMIGIFDSGLGGLTILKHLLKELPDYNYIYLGDNARVPYGGRDNDTIYRYTEEAVDFLFRQGCQLIILACNTASSVALRKIQQEYLPSHYPFRRVLGVIRPAVEVVAEASFNKRIGVIGTEATINSGAFERELHKISPQIKVFSQACPLLVPIIEAGELQWKGLDLILDKYLGPLKKKNIDTLILGCTHYGLILDKIQRHIGKGVRIMAEEQIIPAKLQDYLWRHPEIEKKISRQHKVLFLATSLSQRFTDLTTLFLGRKVEFQIVNLK